MIAKWVYLWSFSPACDWFRSPFETRGCHGCASCGASQALTCIQLMYQYDNVAVAFLCFQLAGSSWNCSADLGQSQCAVPFSGSKCVPQTFPGSIWDNWVLRWCQGWFLLGGTLGSENVLYSLLSVTWFPYYHHYFYLWLLCGFGCAQHCSPSMPKVAMWRAALWGWGIWRFPAYPAANKNTPSVWAASAWSIP